MSRWRERRHAAREGGRVVTAVGAALVLALAGCGGDDDADANGTSAVSGDDQAETEPGDSAGDAAPAAPEVGDVGIPLHPSAEAVSTIESGPITVVQYIVPIDEQADAIAFYDDWTANEPDDYQRVEAETGGVSWQDAPDEGGDKHLIAVLSPLEGDDFVTVTLSVGPVG